MVSSMKKHTINIGSRDSAVEKGLFLKRVGTLLEEGYALKDALSFLLKIEKGTVRKWILSIQEGLMSGSSFHKELEKVGFSDKVCSQIYLAAQYGNYGQTIARCGDHLLEQLKKEKKIQSLLSYPMFLLLFLLGMLLMMRYLILPNMTILLRNTGLNEDILANWIVRLVYYSPQLIVTAIVFVLLGIFIMNRYMKDKSFIEKIQLYMKIPFVENFLKDYYSHFFFFEWGDLFRNGCSFQEIVEIMKGEDASKLLNETGEVLSKEMKEGKPIHEALQTLPFFYEEGIQVVMHGENLGKMGTEMLIYAAYCENQLHRKMEHLMSRLQPIIFSIVGLMIIAIYSAMMLPVFSIMEGI